MRKVSPFPTIRSSISANTSSTERSKNKLKGGSPVQTLLRTTGRPGQIQYTQRIWKRQNNRRKKKNLTLNSQGHRNIINIFIVTYNKQFFTDSRVTPHNLNICKYIFQIKNISFTQAMFVTLSQHNTLIHILTTSPSVQLLLTLYSIKHFL